MNRKALIAIVTLVLVASVSTALVIGCSNEVEALEVYNYFSGLDCTAPTLVSVRSQSSSVVKLEFSEPVKVYGTSFSPFTARADGKYVYVTLSSILLPGVQSSIEGRVKDYSGNTVGLSVSVWGFNPQSPKLLINEFTTKGSTRSPDRTELLVLEDGNLNGLALYGGTPEDHDCRVIFGDRDVRKGDYVVVWWTEALPEDVPEKLSNVVNVCSCTETGLPSNNGVLVLCDTPALGANVLDCVVYSNFSASHQGFGTRSALERVQWVLSSGAWKGDAVDSTSSTATRSMSRRLGREDTDTFDDWYITVTSGSTFGSFNGSDEF